MRLAPSSGPKAPGRRRPYLDPDIKIVLFVKKVKIKKLHFAPRLT
jgi:hypothetical protein